MTQWLSRNFEVGGRQCISPDVLHLSAAGVVRLCQNEVTAASITLAAVLFELLCIRDGSCSTEFDLKTVLLLTVLTVSVDIDVLDVLYVFLYVLDVFFYFF